MIHALPECQELLSADACQASEFCDAERLPGRWHNSGSPVQVCGEGSAPAFVGSLLGDVRHTCSTVFVFGS